MYHHVYYQRQGKFFLYNHTYIAYGYAGNGGGLNNPDAENIVRVGPLPCGFYDISNSYNDEHLGPCVMALTAWKPLYGRGGFRIHGDNAAMNKTASQGCIVLNRNDREMIATSGVKVLAVLRE